MLIQHTINFNSLVIFGFILLLGLIGGHLAKSTHIFPRITGYMFFGLIFGPNVFNIISNSVIAETKPLTDIAVALVLFRLGMQIHYQYLLDRPMLVVTSIIECALTFMLVYVALTSLHVYWVYAMFAAIISMTSFPIMNKLRGNPEDHEHISRRGMTLAASNNLIAFILFTLMIPCVHIVGSKYHFSFYTSLIDPLYQLVGPMALALIMGYFTIRIGKLLGKVENLQFILIVGALTLCIGLARMFALSGMISALLLGIVITNLDSEEYMLQIEPGHTGEILFILLFVLTGAKLHLAHLFEGGLVVLALIAARFAGKLITSLCCARGMGLTIPQSFVLALTLYPMAGMAISLVNIAQDIFPDMGILSAIILAALSVIESTAPILTRLAVRQPVQAVGAELLLHR